MGLFGERLVIMMGFGVLKLAFMGYNLKSLD